jgi:hypothetical protein
VARAWDDEPFRRLLLAEPEDVLREEGIDVPPGVAVRVVEGDETREGEGAAYLRLPARPAAEDLIEDDLSFEGGSAYKHSRSHSCSCFCFRAEPPPDSTPRL